MKTIFVILIAIGFSACAVNVPYKKFGDDPGWASRVGYSDFEIGKNKYKITYTGGVYDSSQKVMKFTYKRAKDLCSSKGFKEYDISNTTSDRKGVSTSNSWKQDSKSQSIYSLDVECK